MMSYRGNDAKSATSKVILPVDDLCCAVDVAAADPGGRHREDADEHANVAPGEHDLLLGERSIDEVRDYISVGRD